MNNFRLSDCCLSISDGDHLAPPKTDEGVPFITIRNFDTYNDIDFSETMSVPEEYYDGLKSIRKPQRGDILYSVVGSFGIPVLIKEDNKFVFQRHIAILRPNPQKVDTNYLFQLMRSESFYAVADILAIGSAQRTISLTSLRQISIELPSLEIQQKIGCVLSEYDELIAINRKKIQVLEEMAMRTYREWFVHMRFPGHETTPIKDGLPEGWKYEQLNNFLKFERGLSYTSEEIASNEGELLINLKNIVAYGGYNYNGSKYYSGDYKSRYIIKGGDLVMGVTDMTQDRRTVGAVALIPFSINRGVISADLVKLKSKLPNCYLYGLFRYGNLSSHISEFANGSNVLHLKPDSIQKQIVKLPTKELIDKYSLLIEPILQQIDMINLKNSDLQQMRDKLLPQLMSEKFKVKP